MSYCVNCGVELDRTAEFCPLCGTAAINPGQPVDTGSPKPFPEEAGEVTLVSKQELALLVTTMLVSVAVCCGVLNVFLRAEQLWSLYVIGAAVMLWIWLVPPLLIRGLHLLIRLATDVGAVLIYVYMISLNTSDGQWFMDIGLPVILWGGALVLLLCLLLKMCRRSILVGTAIVIISGGVFVMGIELLLDRWLVGAWSPSWSLVVLAVCIGLDIPLVVIRQVPSMREEARRRFHM